MFVKQAAIRCRGITWTLPRPARHHHILHVMRQALHDAGTAMHLLDEREVQGFLTNTGAFLTREQAADVVRKGSPNQLRRFQIWGGRRYEFEGPGDPMLGRELYSEDLW